MKRACGDHVWGKARAPSEGCSVDATIRNCSLDFRWTPHPAIVTIMDNRDCIRVLLYSQYTTITGWGGPPNLDYWRPFQSPRSLGQVMPGGTRDGVLPQLTSPQIVVCIQDGPTIAELQALIFFLVYPVGVNN